MLLDLIEKLHSPWKVFAWIGVFIVAFLVCILITKLSNAIFKRIQRRHPGLHVMFLHHILTILIVIGFIILVISNLAGVQTIWTTMVGGTAIISAVLAFAAQDIIKDVLAGMMISAHNPFKVGDRVTLEDGTTGVVEDITLHHVVIRGVESLRHVIPNHVINSMRLTSYNFKTTTRSAVFKFSVGYDSDMTQVKRVIAKAVAECPYAVKGHTDKNGDDNYGEVYFMSFADSALIMQTTVYYRPSVASERVIDDINVRVREALIANNIEIPYNYVNVVEKPEEKAKKPTPKPVAKAPEPIKAPVRAAISPAKAPVAPVRATVTPAKAPVKASVTPARPTVKPTSSPIKTPVKPVVKTAIKPATAPVKKK